MIITNLSYSRIYGDIRITVRINGCLVRLQVKSRSTIKFSFATFYADFLLQEGKVRLDGWSESVDALPFAEQTRFTQRHLKAFKMLSLRELCSPLEEILQIVERKEAEEKAQREIKWQEIRRQMEEEYVRGLEERDKARAAYYQKEKEAKAQRAKEREQIAAIREWRREIKRAYKAGEPLHSKMSGAE